MLRSKLIFGLATAVMVLVMVQSGYAQLQITITGNASSRETETNRTAETNTPTSSAGVIISGSLLSDAFVSGGSIVITYPSTVTNSTTIPAADAVRLSSRTGIFANATVAVGASTSTTFRRRVTITLTGVNGTPPQMPGAPASCPGVAGCNGTIILEGVRIDANGLTAPANASVSMSGETNVLLSTTSFEVITSLRAGIGSVGLGGIPAAYVGGNQQVLLGGSAACPGSGFRFDCGIATIFTNRSVPDAFATFTVTEGHTRAWFNASATQFTGVPGGFDTDAGFRLTFSGIPSGVSLTLAVSEHTLGAGVTVNHRTTAITSTANTVNVTFTGDLPLGTFDTDSITFRITGITVSATATLSPGSISVTGTMIPIGTALDDADARITTPLPRFAEAQVGPATIVAIVPANTTLLIPFAVAEGAFDTGISLANTSADPFGVAGGGATAQSGAVNLAFFPRAAAGAGTPFALSTSSTVRPGIGLSADGTLAAGSTWTVLLSELLRAAGQTSFTGYIFIRADFVPAHGAPFVSDFRNFTSFTPMLVLPPPSVSPRIGVTAVETLTF